MKWYLDFGHGGSDPGAVGANKTKESELALKIGMLVKSRLIKANETVITTRENDTYYSLSYRTSKANTNNCDYFVSIHLNSATNTSAKGCEVWVYDETSKLYSLSKNLCINLSKSLNTPNRGVKISKKFSVLKNTKMPALLIEVDFISNIQVETSLSSDKFIKNIADTIASTLLQFVNKSIVQDDNLDNDLFYKVCIGAFKNKQNATLIKEKAIEKGFRDSYIFID